MAKQNFLKGGYVGKLGATIGQRWKDKRVVRTYTKPRNPRTPKQQAMRANFALANKLAQQAMLINGGQGIWDTSTSPEYSLRVGQAMRMLQAGVPPDQALPLYPVAPEQKAAVKIINATNSGNDSILVTLTGYKNLPIATLRGTAYFMPLDTAGTFYESNIEIDFDTATGQFEIPFEEVLLENPDLFMAVGLDLKTYDAGGTEIPTAKVDWAYYNPNVAGIFPIENFSEDLTLTGKMIPIQQGNATNISLETIDPEELEGTLAFYGATYEGDADNTQEYGVNSAVIDATQLPTEIETYVTYSPDFDGFIGSFWYVYQRGSSVFCSAGIGNFTK